MSTWSDVLQPGPTAGKLGCLWRRRLGIWRPVNAWKLLRWEGKVLVAFRQKALNSKECQQLVPYQLDSYERNFFKKQENRILLLLLFCWFTFFLKTAQRCVLKGMEAQEHYLKGFYIISDMEFKRSVSQDAWPSADIKLQANLTGGEKKKAKCTAVKVLLTAVW